MGAIILQRWYKILWSYDKMWKIFKIFWKDLMKVGLGHDKSLQKINIAHVFMVKEYLYVFYYDRNGSKTKIEYERHSFELIVKKENNAIL